MAWLRLLGVLECPLEKWELKHSEVYQCVCYTRPDLPNKGELCSISHTKHINH